MKKIIKIVACVVLVALLVGGFVAYKMYGRIYEPNIFLRGDKDSDSLFEYLFIPTGSNMDSVIAIAARNFDVRDTASLRQVMELKNYKKKTRAGRYLIKNGMSNSEFVNLLRSGEQAQMKVVLNFFRTSDEVARAVSEILEMSYGDFVLMLNDDEFLAKQGVNRETVVSLFIPNTYYFNWNTSAEGFIERMKAESDKFWNEDRLAKASALGLSSKEVVTLASIVERECRFSDEQPRVAGVYLNRLKKNMLLQADPTVVYACGNFDVRRVLKAHTEIDSPYNTYKYKGLPPGPICTPSGQTIDNVLNAEKHKYLFFCAKADFSGYHAFASTNAEHMDNARKFQKALNERKIYR